jgi:ParB family chromosome partitioning protein
MSRQTSTIQRDRDAVLIPLSKLAPSRRNPRRVKPERDAHRRLVASIRAHGLLQPLIVRPVVVTGDDVPNGRPGAYRVTAGHRRLAALREVHRGDDAVRVPCVVRPADTDDAADAQALAENFAREPMHPLDEATAFAKLAREDGRDAEAIAADFGVTPGYVRQRMKLADLTDAVQSAYRAGEIDTATAEAFAAVPPDRQAAVWAEVGGRPQHAAHVRNVIANGWVDAAHALFDVSQLPDWTVSRDLFGDRVLIERAAFLSGQSEALAAERQRLTEDGWAEVVAGCAADVRDRLWSMAEAPHAYDEPTTAKLAKLAVRRQELEDRYAELDGDNDPDDAKSDALAAKLEAVDAAERALVADAAVRYAEGTKAVGTAFLSLDPDGRVRREYRVPRPGRGNAIGGRHASVGPDGVTPAASPPTSDDLREGQLATTFTHQALAVRQALLANPAARRRLLALLLHDRVRGEALAVRRDANAVTLHADHADGFTSAAHDDLRQRRDELDPIRDRPVVSDADGYADLTTVPDAQVDALINLLTVECVTAHLLRRTDLVCRLATDLAVDVRHHWRPDAAWLAGYQRAQLVHLVYQLRGPAFGPAAERKKKGELVAEVAQLFADAAEGRLTDAPLAERVNTWLPSNLRSTPGQADAPVSQAEAA